MNAPITNMATFKQRLSEARTITVTNHRIPKHSGPRQVLQVGATVFYWRKSGTPAHERARTAFPKASALRIDGPDQVTFIEDGALYLTVTFDNPDVA